MLEDFHAIDKSIGGIVGLFLGFFIGSIAMFKKLSGYDESIESQSERINELEKHCITRDEFEKKYDETRAEVKEFHRDVSRKLDAINQNLGEIKIVLAGKADRRK